MSNNQYDDIANVLKEAHRRYGAEYFNDPKRLRGLLSDHLSGFQNEINITISAIEGGVAQELLKTGAQGVDIQINRISEGLEKSRGIREDVSRSVVAAIAYSMGLTDLPSTHVSAISSLPQDMPKLGSGQMNPGQHNSDGSDQDEWLGLSQAVDGGAKRDAGRAGARHQASNGDARGNSYQASPEQNDIVGQAKNNPKLVIGVLAALAIAYLGFGGNNSNSGNQPQQGQPQQGQPQQGQPQQGQPQQGQPQQGQGFYMVDSDRVRWDISPANTDQNRGVMGFITNTPQGTLLMTLTANPQTGKFALLVSQNGTTSAQGTASPTDETHIEYQYTSSSGQTGSGVFHLNHSP